MGKVDCLKVQLCQTDMGVDLSSMKIVKYQCECTLNVRSTIKELIFFQWLVHTINAKFTCDNKAFSE
jgi:hypothetical protein